MITLVHKPIDTNGLFILGNEVTIEFEGVGDLREYESKSLEYPMDFKRRDAIRQRNSLFQTLPPIPNSPQISTGALFLKSSLATLWDTTFYDASNCASGGKKITLSNWDSSIDYVRRLSNYGLNDKVSSVKVGDAVLIVLLCQHKNFGGDWLILSGFGAECVNLSKYGFNNRASSVLTATVSLAQIIPFLFGLMF